MRCRRCRPCSQACVKRDERALRTFIQRYIQLPLPDYGGRHALLQSFAQVGWVGVGSSGLVVA